MKESPNTTTHDSQPCGACKRIRPRKELRRMWQLPLIIVNIVYGRPGDEGERLYCRRCVWSQSMGAVFLALMAFVLVALLILKLFRDR